jgi:hypothetical protein
MSGLTRAGQTAKGVPKAAKMHHFGHQGAEIAAIKRIIVFDHNVTATAPLNITWHRGRFQYRFDTRSGGFLVATAQQG